MNIEVLHYYGTVLDHINQLILFKVISLTFSPTCSTAIHNFNPGEITHI